MLCSSKNGFLQLAAEKKTSFWQAWQTNIRPFLFRQGFRKYIIIILTLFLIFLLIFFRDFSSALVRGNFDGIGYPSDIRVFFSSSVKIKTPHPSVWKEQNKPMNFYVIFPVACPNVVRVVNFIAMLYQFSWDFYNEC